MCLILKYSVLKLISSIKCEQKMTTKEVKFHPGAAKYGNFINYYDFNAPESRLELLPEDLTSILELDHEDRRIVCLDVGCNSGEMTFALQDRLSCGGRNIVDFLAVDLDEALIERAREKSSLLGRRERVTFEQLDVMDNQLTTTTFQTYLDSGDRTNSRRFDLGFCLSITMWIHLNHGDEGLNRFLRIMSSWVDRLVVEPQPLRCYKNAVRRMRRLGCSDFPHHPNTLRLRDNDPFRHVDEILVEECDMVPVFSFGHTKNWKRPILLYKRKT